MIEGNCFACGKPLKCYSARVACADDQEPEVGPECFRKIKAAGATGWQPTSKHGAIGPRLYTLEHRPVPE